MSNNQHYWVNRESRALQAQQHTLEMGHRFPKAIEECIKKTRQYGPNFKNYEDIRMPVEITVVDQDSVTAVLNHKADNKIAVLNFASYKNPGGAFLAGSKAQEECLCHESFLYNVLSKKMDYYEWNNMNKNKALYLNRALYSPNVRFERGENVAFCDVLTCAAPNKSAAQKYQSVTDEDNLSVLRDRIHFMLDVAKDNKVDTLVLGAWGCGVFGQDAKEVAEAFKEALETTHACFKTVVFAVPASDRDNNLEIFQEVFSQKRQLQK